MYSPAVCSVLALSLLPVLALVGPASPAVRLVVRQDPVEDPNCTGCGISNSVADNQALVNQIDTTIRYDVPGDSTQQGWTGETTNSDGSPALQWSFEAAGGGSDLGATQGTIGGDLLQSQMQDLVNSQSQTIPQNCASANGQYYFSTGSGANCAGDGGP